MAKAIPRLQALKDTVSAEARRRYARWDDRVFESAVSWQADSLWRMLERHPAKVRDHSILVYLNVVASGVGAGYVTVNDETPRTLMAAFLCNLMPGWFARSRPEIHAEVAATAWNLADGARREGAWMEQYLLARVAEFYNPMTLEQQAFQLLKPVLEPQPAAAWKGPFAVTVINMALQVRDFLPGEISIVTPSLIRIGDRRHDRSVGVLLAKGKPQCIGPMDGVPPATLPVPTPAVSVSWTADRVTVANAVVVVPLLACEPLHTLVLANGYLLAVVQNSQRLWVVETP